MTPNAITDILILIIHLGTPLTAACQRLPWLSRASYTTVSKQDIITLLTCNARRRQK